MRNLKRHKKFVDLGHGVGKAIITALFVANFQEYHGIEILPGLEYIFASSMMSAMHLSVEKCC